jgi:hypothetical protein
MVATSEVLKIQIAVGGFQGPMLFLTLPRDLRYIPETLGLLEVFWIFHAPLIHHASSNTPIHLENREKVLIRAFCSPTSLAYLLSTFL